MSAAAIQPISVAELAKRFQRGTRWASARMRQMRHMKTGGQMFTTEEWLAEWLAAESIPQQNWPKQNLDPLEEAVCSRVIEVIGDLTRLGKIQVLAV
jgi:hypothetical protein